MKRTTKPNYAPPTSEVVEVKFQGVLCQSPTGGVQNYDWNTIPIE